jgi:hypothetical protein
VRDPTRRRSTWARCSARRFITVPIGRSGSSRTPVGLRGVRPTTTDRLHYRLESRPLGGRIRLQNSPALNPHKPRFCSACLSIITAYQ